MQTLHTKDLKITSFYSSLLAGVSEAATADNVKHIMSALVVHRV
jgi:hypothetical protein